MPESNIIPVLTSVPDSPSVPLHVSRVPRFRREGPPGPSFERFGVYYLPPGKRKRDLAKQGFPHEAGGGRYPLGDEKVHFPDLANNCYLTVSGSETGQ
jgi:hypothetical protein